MRQERAVLSVSEASGLYFFVKRFEEIRVIYSVSGKLSSRGCLRNPRVAFRYIFKLNGTRRQISATLTRGNEEDIRSKEAFEQYPVTNSEPLARRIPGRKEARAPRALSISSPRATPQPLHLADISPSFFRGLEFMPHS